MQSFSVGLPQGDERYWLAAYPLASFTQPRSSITIASIDGAKLPEAYRSAFDRIQVGSASDSAKASDYAEPYRNQFHAS